MLTARALHRGVVATVIPFTPDEVSDVPDLERPTDHLIRSGVRRAIQALNRYLEYDPGYVNACKAALAMMGLPGGPVRAPMLPLTAAERAGIRRALRELKLLRR